VGDHFFIYIAHHNIFSSHLWYPIYRIKITCIDTCSMYVCTIDAPM